MANPDFDQPYPPPPQPMFPGGRAMQGLGNMWQNLGASPVGQGFQSIGHRLNPVSNQLLFGGMGMLSGGTRGAMKGLIAGKVLDKESGDERKLRQAIAALREGSGVMPESMTEADWNYLQSDPDALSTAFGARMKPADYGEKYTGYLQAKAEGYEGSWMDYQREFKGEGAVTVDLGGGTKFSDIMSMRKDFEGGPGVSSYRLAIPKLKSMASSVSDTTGASDYQFVYGLAQIFDPDSIVQKGEQGMAISSQAVPATIRGRIQQMTAGGGTLGPELRRELVEAAAKRVAEYRAQAEAEEQYYRDFALRHDIPPEDIVRGLEEMPDLGGAAADEPFTVEP